MIKPLTKERSKKGKVVSHMFLMFFQSKKKGKWLHEAHLAIAGMENPHPLVALIDVDSPVAAPITPLLDIVVAAAVVAQKEKISMEQIERSFWILRWFDLVHALHLDLL